MRQILVDPAYANTMGATAVHQAFSFEADGSVLGPDGPQSDSLIQATSVNYMARYDDEAKAAIEEIVANYKTRMSDTRTLDNFSDVDSINDFLKTNKTGDLDKTNDDLPDLYQVALQAYGLTEEELSKSVMRKLLASDPYDPEGYVASFKDDRITQLARAFNFDGEGNASIQLQALSPAAMAKYATNYKSHVTMLMKDGPLKEKASKDATEEVDYFAKTMESVQSLDDFLEDDRLTGLILKSVGLDPKDYDEETLRRIFTSDPDDANSYLNTKADSKFKNLVADFNLTRPAISRAPSWASSRIRVHSIARRMPICSRRSRRRKARRTWHALGALLRPQGAGYHLALLHPRRQGALPGHHHRLQPAEPDLQHGCREAGCASRKVCGPEGSWRLEEGRQVGEAVHGDVRHSERHDPIAGAADSDRRRLSRHVLTLR
ncbi:hypothetical protein AJ87_15270 [Rhizobium yanglingense]|nr:hypothetical protein AJ87_15270 [Rhizobium yanglingense]